MSASTAPIGATRCEEFLFSPSDLLRRFVPPNLQASATELWQRMTRRRCLSALTNVIGSSSRTPLRYVAAAATLELAFWCVTNAVRSRCMQGRVRGEIAIRTTWPDSGITCSRCTVPAGLRRGAACACRPLSMRRLLAEPLIMRVLQGTHCMLGLSGVGFGEWDELCMSFAIASGQNHWNVRG